MSPDAACCESLVVTGTRTGKLAYAKHRPLPLRSSVLNSSTNSGVTPSSARGIDVTKQWCDPNICMRIDVGCQDHYELCHLVSY